MIAAKLVNAQGMFFACVVQQGIMAVKHFGIVEFVEEGQAHTRDIVVANHGLVGAMYDNLDGQFRVFHNFAQLFEGQFVGGCAHDQTVFFEELGCQMVKEVKGYIRLNGQVCQALSQLQGA